jgi:alpha-glucosidase
MTGMLNRAMTLCLAVVLPAGTALAAARDPVFKVASPGKGLEVTVSAGKALTWAVTLDGKALLAPSPLSMSLEDGRVLGREGHLARHQERSVDRMLHPVVARKRSEQPDRFRELRLDFKEGYAVLFRAYDEGVAYRFVTTLPGRIKVHSEEAVFAFTADHPIWFPKEDSYLSHQERLCLRIPLSAIGTQFASLPAVVEAGPAKVAITESDLLDYPGMDLASAGPTALKGLFWACPRTLKAKNDRTQEVVDREPWIAEVAGTRSFPWRILAVAREDRDLLTNDLVYCLASERVSQDTDWIRPGKVAWDWWNDNNVYGVDFRAGVNTETYKYYIDFAAKYGLEYIILDEGWSPGDDLLRFTPGMDVAELVRYGREKGVGVILWCTWLTLDRQFDQAFEAFEKLGVKGIKVDFMQREDQTMVRFYERTAREALRRHLLVSFHGAYKPTGLHRTFPNVLTHEGVKGLENDKWGPPHTATPENAVTFPFARMLAGPVDYTPGGMLNATRETFAALSARPMTLGTRCAQLAMYALYEAPLQMLADSPSNYERENECTAFIARFPTTWDETRALDARMGQYLLMARRKGSVWFAGALTNWTPRDLTLDTAFLGTGRWRAEIFRDGVNADRCAVDYRREVRDVKAGEALQLHLAPGGGWAARFERLPD